MQTSIGDRTEPARRAGASGSTESSRRLPAAARIAADWLSERLALRATEQPARPRRAQIASICASVFLIAIGVRLLHWQDRYAEIARGEPWVSGIVRHYKVEARRMLEGGGILFPRDEINPGDARPVLHPPGYSILMAGIFSLWGDSNSAVRLVQVICDGLAAVMVFFIALELLNSAIAIIAGMLVALSPHNAFHSLWLSPDTLPVLPILVAVYFVVKASKRPRLAAVIAAGAMVGVSCWLRANALMLAPFLAVVFAILLGRGKRLRYGLSLVAAAVVVIAPITVRNWILFHHFIPLSVAGGENLVVGIADFDKEGRFGMPASDPDAALKDAEWHNRPEYASNPWVPDGIDRDRYRYVRGLEVIRSHPFWYARVMISRAAFMLNYNDRSSAVWPFDTSKAPIVSAVPAMAHSPASIDDAEPVWSSTASELIADGARLSEQAEVSVDAAGQTLRICGDASEFDDQFASGPISVKPKTDYVLTLRMKPGQGPVAAKLTSLDRRIALASVIVDRRSVEKAPGKSGKTESLASEDDPAAGEQMGVIQMPFASGDRAEVRLVISNNGPASSPRVAEAGPASLFELGATPYQWTRYPRVLVRGIQKNLFNTNVMLPLVIAGGILLLLAGRSRALVMLLAVPAYYFCFQSALSTEYRYILAIHYFLFVMSALTLYCAGVAIGRVTVGLKARVLQKSMTKQQGLQGHQERPAN